jgi:KDO2-lipid IV(A) lauroyltransferase
MRSLLIPLVRTLLWLIARLPLPIVHGIGIGLGWLVFLLSRKTARMMSSNILASGLAGDNAAHRHVLRRNIAESGKALLETFAIWQRNDATVLSWVRHTTGWEHVEAALQTGKGIIFLTPHLGCFEITSIYFAARHPITILYRPPRQNWMMPMIQTGRARGQAKLAPANSQGVRDLLIALKRGEAVGILPDQTPSKGEGEWAPFFDRPAYTMTLASKLAQKTGAAVIMAFGERLPYGHGYHLHLVPVAAGQINTTTGLNEVIETQIRQCPEQYLWSYNRHKTLPGASLERE